jgi:hypothetical protein
MRTKGEDDTGVVDAMAKDRLDDVQHHGNSNANKDCAFASRCQIRISNESVTVHLANMNYDNFSNVSLLNIVKKRHTSYPISRYIGVHVIG